MKLVDGRDFDRRQLLLEALRLEVNESTLFWVGMDLQPEETVTLADGRVLDSRALLVQAVGKGLEKCRSLGMNLFWESPQVDLACGGALCFLPRPCSNVSSPSGGFPAGGGSW